MDIASVASSAVDILASYLIRIGGSLATGAEDGIVRELQRIVVERLKASRIGTRIAGEFEQQPDDPHNQNSLKDAVADEASRDPRFAADLERLVQQIQKHNQGNVSSYGVATANTNISNSGSWDNRGGVVAAGNATVDQSRRTKINTGGLIAIIVAAAILTFGVGGPVAYDMLRDAIAATKVPDFEDSPKGDLQRAMYELNRTSYRQQSTGGPTLIKSAVDPMKRISWSDAAGGGAEISTIRIGDSLWMKANFGLLAAYGVPADKWMHIDLKRVPPNARGSLGASDSDGVDALISAISTVAYLGNGKYAGTLDLAKAGIVSGPSSARARVASNTSFEATVDESGRLATFTMDLGSGLFMINTYTDYGAPVTVNRPAKSEVVEAPDTYYTSVDAT